MKFTKLNCGSIIATTVGKVLRILTPEEDGLVAGLYDKDDNLLASWGTLVRKYGLEVSTDFSGSVLSNPTHISYILLNNPELQGGVKLKVGKGVTRIGKGAFTNAPSQTVDDLQIIILPEGVTTIAASAFWLSTAETITLPASLTSIGFAAFEKYLKNIYYNGTVNDWNNISKANNFDGDASDYIIYCSDAMLDSAGNIIEYEN